MPLTREEDVDESSPNHDFSFGRGRAVGQERCDHSNRASTAIR
jgi:hypothetical protein